jgi:hypothetical protein
MTELGPEMGPAPHPLAEVAGRPLKRRRPNERRTADPPDWKNTSKDGSTYYAGYLGGVKLLLLKNKKAGEGEAPWTLLVTARPEKGASAAAKPTADAKPYPQHRNAQSRPVDPAFDDPIGF